MCLGKGQAVIAVKKLPNAKLPWHLINSHPSTISFFLFPFLRSVCLSVFISLSGSQGLDFTFHGVYLSLYTSFPLIRLLSYKAFSPFLLHPYCQNTSFHIYESKFDDVVANLHIAFLYKKTNTVG